MLCNSVSREQRPPRVAGFTVGALCGRSLGVSTVTQGFYAHFLQMMAGSFQTMCDEDLQTWLTNNFGKEVATKCAGNCPN